MLHCLPQEMLSRCHQPPRAGAGPTGAHGYRGLLGAGAGLGVSLTWFSVNCLTLPLTEDSQRGVGRRLACSLFPRSFTEPT